VEVALVVLGLALVGSVIAIVILARMPGALVDRCAELVAKIRADNEEQIKDRDALRAATLRANEQEALHTYERARADDATEQLGKTQIALEAAKALVARERVKRIEGMSVDELLVGVNAEIAALSEQPGTALEKPE
jgi:hypothetical protein